MVTSNVNQLWLAEGVKQPSGGNRQLGTLGDPSDPRPQEGAWAGRHLRPYWWDRCTQTFWPSPLSQILGNGGLFDLVISRNLGHVEVKEFSVQVYRGSLTRQREIASDPIKQYVCMCICVCVHTYVYVYICMCASVYICLCLLHPISNRDLEWAARQVGWLPG